MTARAFVVALTGGIAAGKSSVARRFAALGVPVFAADVAAHDVLAPGSDALAEVTGAFGSEVLARDGSLDRARMRHRVFADADARHALEAIVHPRIARRLRAHLGATDAAYVILDIPLLAETWPQYAWVDRVLVIDVPSATQMQRLLERDDIDRALAQRMLAAQATRAQRLALADDVIDNAGPKSALDAAVAALHARYRKLAGQLPDPPPAAA